MSDSWSPAQYEKFKAERAQPFHDLLGLVQRRPGMRAVDLGCGTGELTRILHQALSASETVGIDSSAAMLEKAAPQAAAPGLTFRTGKIEEVALQRPDLIFTNAALQWVDDHPSVLRRLFAALPEGGQLAVQMPANFDHPSHRVADELAAEPPFREMLAGYQRQSPVLRPEQYSQLLYDLGFSRQTVRLQVYAHVLAGPEQVVEWVQGTLLTPIKAKLSPADYERFLQTYREKLIPQLNPQRPFLYTFKRILFWAAK